MKLDEIIKGLNKKYGDQSVIKLSGDNTTKLDIDFVPCGLPSIDAILGGGLPRGRMIELFGTESTGKSSLAMFWAAEIQRNGGKAVLIDAEHAFNPDYAKNVLGLDTDNLLVSQPTTAEESFDIIQKMIESNEIDIIIIDSIAALVPKKELEGEITDQHMALLARMMSQSLRILTSSIAKSKTVVVFINQVREKIGVFYGLSTTTPGGRALKFFSSIRLEVSKGKAIKEGERQTGHIMKARVVKNKVGVPFKDTEFKFYYDKGFSIAAKPEKK